MTAQTTTQPEFVAHCLDLLASTGPCVAKRMFGGWGISTGGLTLAIIANLGDGERLWLKADATTRATFEAQGCARFTYLVKGQPKSMDYYAAPEDAVESAALMRPWGQLALDAAVRAQAAKKPKKAPAQASTATPAKAVKAVKAVKARVKNT